MFAVAIVVSAMKRFSASRSAEGRGERARRRGGGGGGGQLGVFMTSEVCVWIYYWMCRLLLRTAISVPSTPEIERTIRAWVSRVSHSQPSLSWGRELNFQRCSLCRGCRGGWARTGNPETRVTVVDIFCLLTPLAPYTDTCTDIYGCPESVRCVLYV